MTETIKIDEDGRYLMIVESDHFISMEQIERAQLDLQQWWNNGDKFFILQVGDGVNIKFERVDKDEN